VNEDIVELLGGKLGCPLTSGEYLVRGSLTLMLRTLSLLQSTRSTSLSQNPERPDARGISATCDYKLRSQWCCRRERVFKDLHKYCRYTALDTRAGAIAWPVPGFECGILTSSKGVALFAQDVFLIVNQHNGKITVVIRRLHQLRPRRVSPKGSFPRAASVMAMLRQQRAGASF
jgi:hypothetical protein